MATTMTPKQADERVQRLSDVSAKRLLDPDTAVPGGPGPGQVLPDELLSTAGLDFVLTADQKARLSREEVAAIASEGVRFESVLTAGFSLHLADTWDLTDPRVTYILHELGEETRHSRLFIRLVDQLGATAASDNPFATGLPGFIRRRIINFAIRRPVLLYVLVLAGEEIPDLIQKRLTEHPDTDPFLREVSRYHRQEEARHLAFARAVLPEQWAQASWLDRLLVRYAAPWVIQGMFETLVHPGVYKAVGLPGWKTWRAALRSAPRVQLRHEATSSILNALVDAGAIARSRIPKPWRMLTGVGG
ncbi:MAG TPA: diiron oxygenase [Acidimicrobiales bacterium]|jgi:hypothetical protein|nr:diiron oxygenase [Acidimicrobiales bacterium]